MISNVTCTLMEDVAVQSNSFLFPRTKLQNCSSTEQAHPYKDCISVALRKLCAVWTNNPNVEIRLFCENKC